MDDLILKGTNCRKQRIQEIVLEEQVPEPYREYFQRTAAFLAMTAQACGEERAQWGLEQYQEENHRLYADILPENYGNSYGNPAYAQDKLGEYGPLLSFSIYRASGTIAYAFEKRVWDMTVCQELFLEVYTAFCEEIPSVETLQQILFTGMSAIMDGYDRTENSGKCGSKTGFCGKDHYGSGSEGSALSVSVWRIRTMS